MKKLIAILLILSMSLYMSACCIPSGTASEDEGENFDSIENNSDMYEDEYSEDSYGTQEEECITIDTVTDYIDAYCDSLGASGVTETEIKTEDGKVCHSFTYFYDKVNLHIWLKDGEVVDIMTTAFPSTFDMGDGSMTASDLIILAAGFANVPLGVVAEDGDGEALRQRIISTGAMVENDIITYTYTENGWKFVIMLSNVATMLDIQKA